MSFMNNYSVEDQNEHQPQEEVQPSIKSPSLSTKLLLVENDDNNNHEVASEHGCLDVQCGSIQDTIIKTNNNNVNNNFGKWIASSENLSADPFGDQNEQNNDNELVKFNLK